MLSLKKFQHMSNQPTIREIIDKFSDEFQDLHKNTININGQFFTLSPVLLDAIIPTCLLSRTDPLDILEPSFGTGSLIENCRDKFTNTPISIDGVELSTDLYEFGKDIFKSDQRIHLSNEDFLKFNPRKSYDFIVGNPPFVIIRETHVLSKTYSFLKHGRLNLYAIFLWHCINLLKPNGYLSFIIPKSILSASSLHPLRKYIVNNCDIIDIISPDKATDLFKQVNQNVVVLQLCKKILNPENPFIFIIPHESYVIFSPFATKWKERIPKFKSFADFGVVVHTGSIVSNQVREHLREMPKTSVSPTAKLIYSHTLRNNQLIFNSTPISTKTKHTKTPICKYENLVIEPFQTKIFRGPAILVNRIVSSVHPRIDPVLYTLEAPFFAENHVIVITGDLGKLETIMKTLSSCTTQEFIQEIISGNTQISTSQLQYMIPVLDY